ncbi:PREDICTED: wall-associated receptor kinase-like 8 [Erythranthe guttata]|uniref:wall-associated receptor kinase-like 8 n=1 Tax=Erythranthe guttata TaxID=4155 RepID=UPI00064E0B65|nr:PREDICTED: wall-associated receptor kinase-like 8 [Erythranthe guttata]|eukprot:XP_012848336.1 PREDICTED: wall-associated receptor kinase-like 8 [Erythranthe guttata]
MRIPFMLLRLISSLSLATTLTLAITLSKDGCPSKCGNITIPYPFGIGSSCSANSSFEIVCRYSTNIIPPRAIPFLSSISLELFNISLQGTITINNPVKPMHYYSIQETRYFVASLAQSPFTISSQHNLMVVLGCQNSVWMRANNTATAVGGCIAICDANLTDTNCNGINCCQATIPPRLKGLKYSYQCTNQVGTNNSSCGYAFPVEKKWLRDEYKKQKVLQNNQLNPYDPDFVSAPLVLEWEFNKQELDSTSACKYYSNNSENYGYEISKDYVSSAQYCYCKNGYEGNPYLPQGCNYIDECGPNATIQHCNGKDCFNRGGSYICGPSPSGYVNYEIYIGIGSGLGALIFFWGGWRFTKFIIKKIKANRKRELFKKKLQQHLSSSDNGLDKTKLFRFKELAKATDHYNVNRILGRGGQGTVYKGMLTDGRIVAVKKSMKIEEGDLEVFINEVVILSQINHRNIVKLLGCCLDTVIPLLVYEFIPNGTLFQHVHDPTEEFPLFWEMRVRIAREVAGALSYLHSSASAPIYHRDIKSTNILLDDKYRAKVADFGTSRSVGIDQTHLTTRVQGTSGGSRTKIQGMPAVPRQEFTVLWG